MRAIAAALFAALALPTIPVAAQQSVATGGNAALGRAPLDLRPPLAELAPPSAAPRLASPAPDTGCAPAWPCRLRLFGGAPGKYGGGVGLKAPALTW